MGTISQKLNRVKQTKSKLKDAINIGGGQITDDTIFNNYADEIKDIYMDAINNGVDNIYNSLPKTTKTGSKIELDTEEGKMKITLKGDTQQNSVSGINLIHFPDVLETTVNGITYSIQNDIISLNGTATDNIRYIYADNFAFKEAGVYRITLLPVDSNYTRGVIGISSRSEDKTEQVIWHQVASGELSNAKNYTTENIEQIKNIGLYINSGSVFNNFKFRFMLTSGSNIPNIFSPYTGGIASPNPDYPQDIKTVTGEQKIIIKNSILPNEYTQVDYIQSNGTQYINSNILGSGNIGFDIEWETNDAQTIFGARTEYNSNQYQLTTYKGSGMINGYFGYGTGGHMNNKWHRIYYNYKEKNHISFINNILTLNDDTVVNIPYEEFNTPRTITIFALQGPNGGISEKTSSKLYSLKFYDNGNLIRDFIPCYRNSDNEVGLYDIVNDIFYVNQGTGAFTYGKEIDVKEQNYPITLSSKNKLETSNFNTTAYGINVINDNTHYIINGTSTSYKNISLIDGSQAGNYTRYDTTSKTIRLLAGTYTLSINYMSGDISTTSYLLLCKRGTTVPQEYLLSCALSDESISRTFTLDNDSDIFLGFQFETNTALLDYTFELQLEEGNTATDYVPYIANPLEYCKIGDYADEFIRTSGKNLFNKDKIKLNYTWNDTAAGGRSIFFIETKPNEIYTISALNWNNLYYDIVYLDHIGATTNLYESGWINPGEEPAKTFTITTGTNILGIHFKYQSAGSTMMTQAMFDNATIQLEEGSISTEYEPYGLNEWYLKKNINRTIIDSDNARSLITGTADINGHHVIAIAKSKLGWQTDWSVNIFKLNSYSEITKIPDVKSGTFGSDFIAYALTIFNDDFVSASVAMDLLIGTVIYNPLVTPQYIHISETDYSTLRSQLENLYNNAKSYEDKTYITTTNNDEENLLLEIEVSALAKIE